MGMPTEENFMDLVKKEVEKQKEQEKFDTEDSANKEIERIIGKEVESSEQK